MSKQADAKKAQGYQDKPEKRQCSVCAHYRSDFIKHPQQGFMMVEWIEEKNIHCNIGGFKIKKTAVCNMFERKDEQSS